MTIPVISGNDSRGPWSTNMPHCKLTGNCPTSTQPKPKSSPVHTLKVNTEIPKHKCNDVTKQDDYLLEYDADQVALLTLEKELRSYTSKWHSCMLTSSLMKTRSYFICLLRSDFDGKIY